MGRVYSHSLCNISATGATDTSEGFFLGQRLPMSVPPKVELLWNWAGSVATMVPASYYLFINLFYWKAYVSDQPLNRRAWVVQERFLARRVLHFGRRQLLWECCEREACEQYPFNIPPRLGDHFKKICLSDDSSDSNDTHHLSNWRRIVDTYTSASLTYPSDKAIALSGLVSTFRTLLPHDTYLAGLWLTRLPTELAWNVIDCAQADGRPSALSPTYRAPSFSWLKLDGCIFTQFPNPNPPSLISVIEARVLPALEGGDTASALGGGWIRLAGNLKRVQLLRNPGTKQPQWIMFVKAMAQEGMIAVGMQEVGEMTGVNQALPSLPAAATENLQWLMVPSSVLLDVELPDVVADEGLCAVALLGPEAEFPMVRGLVLAHWATHTGNPAHHGKFLRIGMFMVYTKDAISFMLKHKAEDRDCPCEWFDENTERHTFTII